MTDYKNWVSGLNGFKTHILDKNDFTTVLNENVYQSGRNIEDIFSDHLYHVNGPIEVLYSGGMDSEFVLKCLQKINKQLEIITMVIKVKDTPINIVDLYYSEKFCRENNLKQNFFEFDAYEFYESGEYLEYLLPYKIIEPHVASHFWLINQCHNFPLFGGDWPWVHAHKVEKLLSPFKLEYCCYEQYMQSKNISGIGNMISHSYESTVYFIKKHIESYSQDYDTGNNVTFLKSKMYNMHNTRLRSFGWELCPKNFLNLNKFKLELIKHIGIVRPKIVWQNEIKNILTSNVNENTSFR